MECQESHIDEITCSTHGNLKTVQSDDILRCLKHYRLKVYGYCKGDHQDNILATGRDNFCDKCRQRKTPAHRTRHKNMIGKINQYGLKYTSGPYKQYGKNKNATAWGLECPFCNKEFVTIANYADKAKSCYECRAENKKVSSELSTFKHLYSGVKGRRNSTLKGFGLSLEEFIELSGQDCYYCGVGPAVAKGHREWSAYVKINGLDRIDSSLGYVKDNVVSCCRTCNIAKSTMSREEFFAWAFRLVQHQQNK